jgi:hypothetical protein
MTMATMRRVVIYYLLLELNHGNANNEESLIVAIAMILLQ